MDACSRYSFWLVQRLERDWREKTTLCCEYMGSSEFEWGTIPKSKQRLLSQELVTVSLPIIYQGKSRMVHFLGDIGDIELKIAAMQEWVAGDMRGQESSNFDIAFTGLDWSGKPAPDFYRTLVWWAIEEGTDLVWSLDIEWLNNFISQRELVATPFGLL